MSKSAADLPRALRPPAVAGPLPFHRLYLGLAGYRHWRPLVAIVVAAAVYIVSGVVFFGAVTLVGVALGQIDLGSTAQQAEAELYRLAALDAASPISLVLALGVIVLMLPAALFGQLAAGLRPLGVRHSVAFRIRWRWFAISMLPALVVIAASLAIPAGLAALFGEQAFGPVTTDPSLFLVCAIIIVVVTPFQAAAEEYVFRGLLLQSLGAWVRFAPVGWIVPTLLFAAGHLYDVWGLLSVAAFGFAAAFVVWRTGGLEAPIAMHTVNNIAGFLLLTSGVQGSTVNPVSASPDLAGNIVAFAIAVGTTALWVYWVDRLARRRGIGTRGGMLAPAAPALPLSAQDSVIPPGSPPHDS